MTINAALEQLTLKRLFYGLFCTLLYATNGFTRQIAVNDGQDAYFEDYPIRRV
jgi:hypothetical protein